MGSQPQAVATEPASAVFLAVSGAEMSRGVCYDHAYMGSATIQARWDHTPRSGAHLFVIFCSSTKVATRSFLRISGPIDAIT
jgi:hypothetical protein